MLENENFQHGITLFGGINTTDKYFVINIWVRPIEKAFNFNPSFYLICKNRRAEVCIVKFLLYSLFWNLLKRVYKPGALNCMQIYVYILNIHLSAGKLHNLC